MASERVIWLTDPLPNLTSSITTASKEDINKAIGNSFLTVLTLILIGFIAAAIPRINRMFNIQLPITLPSTISVLLLAKACIETANSGADVPKATIVKPINIFETFIFWAVEEAPSTKKSAPFIKKIKPSIKRIIFNNI